VSTTTPRLVGPEEQIANVQAVLLRFVKRLRDHGKTMRDAERLVGYQLSRSRLARVPWSGDAWAALSAIEHWRRLKAEHAAGRLRPVTDDGPPF
jgi:hypothetical protein